MNFGQLELNPQSHKRPPLQLESGTWLDGQRESIFFFSQLKELIATYQINSNKILKAFPKLLKGNALLWHRNNRDFWVTFTTLEIFTYRPTTGVSNKFGKWDRKRTEGEGEVFHQYVVALSTLICRRRGLSKGEKLEKIYMNMSPDHKMYVGRQDFINTRLVYVLIKVIVLRQAQQKYWYLRQHMMADTMHEKFLPLNLLEHLTRWITGLLVSVQNNNT